MQVTLLGLCTIDISGEIRNLENLTHGLVDLEEGRSLYFVVLGEIFWSNFESSGLKVQVDLATAIDEIFRDGLGEESFKMADL